MKKKIVVMLLAGLACFAFAACGSADTANVTAEQAEAEAPTEAEEAPAEEEAEAEEPEETEEAPAEEAEAATETEEEDDENYETGDASLDDPRNQDDIGEKELLVVSFGTSFNDSRRETIGAIEQALADAYPDWSVRRAFTSQIIIDHVKSRDNVTIDNVEEALARAEKNGVKELLVQPTHLMDGHEYNDLMELLAGYGDVFDSIKVGDPLVTSDDDFSKLAEAVHDVTSSFDDGKTAICFMGHGTDADSNEIYAKMQKVFEEKGYENYYIGTVEATPSLDDVMKAIDGKGYERVVLRPLMVVAGDHANNDMAGDEDDSWKSILEGAGYKVEPVLEGLGQVPAVQQMYVDHAKAAMDK